MNAWLEKLISVPKTIYVNFKVFPFKEALKFRVSVSCRIRCQNLRKGCIEFISPSGKLNIGFSNGSFNMGRDYKGTVSFGKNGKLIIKDKAYLPAGVLINCNGVINLGSNFESNVRLLISCEKKISIGDNPAIGWDVSIVDGDGHDIFLTGTDELK